MSTSAIRIRVWVALLLVLAAVVLGALVGSFATVKAGRLGGGEGIPLLITAADNRTGGQVSFTSGFTPVVRKALPAVVNISSSRTVRAPEEGPGAPFFMDPFFREFFGFGDRFGVPRERREHSLGSGVVVSPDGYILTNDHVIAQATDIKIFRSDQREFRARLVGSDAKTDIAVLKIEEKDLPVLTLGDSSRVQVGEFSLAIGNPFGVGQTVTMGIVGATGRGNLGIEDYEDFIQTDASINPGNSGGALVNVNGDLIGINTAILSRTGGNQGVGFAVPINMARHVMEQILKHGKVIRGWVGIAIQPVTPALAREFGLKEPRGALVSDVTPDSPAARAGLAKGDVVLAINGQPINDSRDLSLKISAMAPGAEVRLRLARGGAERDVTVKLGEMPARPEERAGGSAPRPGAALEGVAVNDLTPQIARQLNLPPNTTGVVVVQVAPASSAAEAGLRRGDVIQEVGRKPVHNVPEFESAARQAEKQSVLLLVNRGGTTHYIVIEPR